jgi:hypothetical protein
MRRAQAARPHVRLGLHELRLARHGLGRRGRVFLAMATIGLAGGGADTRGARAGQARVGLDGAVGPPGAGGALVAPLLGGVVEGAGTARLVALGNRASAAAKGRRALRAGHAGVEGGVVEQALRVW